MPAFAHEDGTGLATANSYVDLDTFKDFADTFGYDYSSLTDTQIETLLIRATMVLDAKYRSDFPGERQVVGQALEWPRSNAVYVDGEEIAESIVPKEVQIALTEMFYVIQSGQTVQPIISSTGSLELERVRIEGAVEEEKRYSSSGAVRDIYTTVTDALSRITGGMEGYYDLKIIRVGGG